MPAVYSTQMKRKQKGTPALKKEGSSSKKSHELKLNLGCGPRALDGFTNIDKYYNANELKNLNPSVKHAEFLQADILALPFQDNAASYIETIDVIEHLRIQTVVPALKDWYRVLKPKGELMILTIDFNGLAQSWIRDIKGRRFNLLTYLEWADVVYGTQVDDGQYHKTPFTKDFLEFCLHLAGFTTYETRIVPRGSPAPTEYRSNIPDLAVRSDMLIAHAWK